MCTIALIRPFNFDRCAKWMVISVVLWCDEVDAKMPGVLGAVNGGGGGGRKGGQFAHLNGCTNGIKYLLRAKLIDVLKVTHTPPRKEEWLYHLILYSNPPGCLFRFYCYFRVSRK